MLGLVVDLGAPKQVKSVEVITQEELQSIPTARDPWVVLQTVPGVVMDRVNVGGSDPVAGNQPTRSTTTWVGPALLKIVSTRPYRDISSSICACVSRANRSVSP